MSADNQRVFLVTGANRGIGFSIVKKLAANHPNDLILLGARDQKRGDDALVQLGSPSNVKTLVLDTSSPESIQHAKQEIEKKYGGKLDVLINNAAIATYGLTSNDLKNMLDTNYYGVKNMNEAFFPLIRDNGRVVNVSSGASAQIIGFCPQELKDKLLSPNITEEQLEETFATLFQAAEQGQDPKTVGFEHPMHQSLVFYGVSKIAVNALTRMEARDWKYPAKNVIISAICPGYCQTDMSSHAKEARPPEMGADSILHGVYDEDLENGQFWRDGKPAPIELPPVKKTTNPTVLEMIQKYEKEQQQK